MISPQQEELLVGYMCSIQKIFHKTPTTGNRYDFEASFEAAYKIW